jgi:hypothetical protein
MSLPFHRDLAPEYESMFTDPSVKDDHEEASKAKL